jgi:hypothetical protein
LFSSAEQETRNRIFYNVPIDYNEENYRDKIILMEKAMETIINGGYVFA